ncbi:MAG: septal ring lytic transglycosylase RlpA family protein [Proteobacteria bacterium]|nr:septal ring lytic transglycosylase RlpA family protein [Pseudomonadota bacterium]
MRRPERSRAGFAPVPSVQKPPVREDAPSRVPPLEKGGPGGISFFLSPALAWALALFLLLSLSACGGRRPYPPAPSPAPAPAPVPSPGAPPPATQRPYKVLGHWYSPLPHARGFTQTGVASWYGKDFHGKKTANGETYDMHAMTCAHKTLPLGTLVQVDNLDNGRSCQLRVNDRGPFVAGRVVDLSYSAAKTLGVVGPGTARVRLTALAPALETDSGPPPTADVFYSGNFTLQVGAFENPENAARLRDKLAETCVNAHVVQSEVNGRTFHRVRVGRATTLDQAESQRQALAGKGFPGAFVVAE